ncbi:5-formyltetrahydrofolate cyclo-ligase [Aridibaculum aurantiacum]|uniref:5-formyltetrahydrofolate cyclo-ligase n=1 Tax=Aridibaculum aurantiacum TaxID=2810307 RepID=UPI001A9734ED|nr:5-formyltetrahydrofolate cyclo-ligase [Aridibaculum aurantiacum]
MTKKELRNIYKVKRKELTSSDRLKMDDLMLIQLQRLAFEDRVQTLLSYWPLEAQAEPNTHLFTYYLENHIPGVRIAYPVINFDDASMKAIHVHEETDFVENKYNIAEPETGEEIPPIELDLVLVPLLAYDNQGYRVGYGKGYYDRYLQYCRADVITVGFSYFEPVDKIDDTDQFDVPLNFCITPHKVYEF